MSRTRYGRHRIDAESDKAVTAVDSRGFKLPCRNSLETWEIIPDAIMAGFRWQATVPLPRSRMLPALS